MDDGRMGLVAMSRALKLAVERRTNGGELVLVGDDDDDDNNGNNATRVVVSTDKNASKAPIASNTTTNVEKDGLDAVERDKAAVTGLAGTIHAANAAAADAATTPTSPLTTETPSGETTTKEGALSSPADDTMTLATTTTTTKIATHDASETIQVLGSRGITSEDAKTPAATAATPEPLASSQDGSKNDNNGGHDDSEAIVQGLDMSDRQAVDAAMRAKNDAASSFAAAVDNNAASEGGLPPSSPTQAQAGTTHRSFAERLSMLSTHSGLQHTAEVDKSEVDKVKHQQQPQSDDNNNNNNNNNNSREDEDKGDGEPDDHGKLPKLDTQPFQLGLDLSLGSGLDFTF
ncbi:hypothetical protein BGW42_000687 [Actinomortierella wolfii]|nr:hypothetical protein BGW42_000687 [Actinomortierella wolfii]